MKIPFTIQPFTFSNTSLQLCVPDETALKEQYTAEQQKGLQAAFPYWAKPWPASVALCDFLAQHPEIIKEKMVVELAAGLGLPSLLASFYAKNVVCSDYLEPALDMIRQSVLLNNIQNIQCRLIDWTGYPEELNADIVLLSDINYDPTQFDVLSALIKSLLNRGTIVILSTPLRIMGKPFITTLLPYCTLQQTGCVEIDGRQTEIFIMQLEKLV